MNFDFSKAKVQAIQLVPALEEIERSNFVRHLAETDDVYSFKHVLVQETAYTSLLRHDRRKLHLQVASSCEDLFANEIDDYLALLAFHFTEAGETTKAVSYWLRYGERAAQQSAYPEAVQAYQHALALVSESAPQRAEMHVRLGDLYCRITDYSAANENFDKALQEAERAGDAVAAATALSGAARVASQQGEHAHARELGERALQFAREANDAEAMARAHRQLGISYNYEGKNALALEHLHVALDLYRALGDEEGTASALNSLGIVTREEKDLERAWNYFQEALTLSQQRGDKYSTGIRLNNLGVIAEQRGDYETATRYQAQAHALALEIGDRDGAALTEINLGDLAMTRGDLALALKHFQHALAEMIALNAIPYALYALAALAKWYLARGELERSAELLGLAWQHPSTTADIQIDFASVFEELQTKLGEQKLQAALARGKEIPLRETVKQILAQTA